MLFRMDVLERIVRGEVTLAFRRWIKAPPAPGATLRTPAGVLVIDSAKVVRPGDVTDDDARRAGAVSREALFAEMPDEGSLIRMEVRYAGEDPRAALRNAPLDADEAAAIWSRLRRMDERAGRPWTGAALRLIAEHPATPAARLAKKAGVDTPLFKRRIRSLKELGLTESLEVGYRLSPRGQALMDHAGDAR